MLNIEIPTVNVERDITCSIFFERACVALRGSVVSRRMAGKFWELACRELDAENGSPLVAGLGAILSANEAKRTDVLLDQHERLMTCAQTEAGWGGF